MYGNAFVRLANPIAFGGEIDESQPSEGIACRTFRRFRPNVRFDASDSSP
jgi:hypothetical protein